jgi:hypothetical protein
MQLKESVKSKVNNSILITGSARSGTSIMGKIIHSLKNVEYVFEPPTLVSLFSVIHEMDEKHWSLLFQTYLYEEFLINAIAGRNLNFNTNDDSCIYNTKPRNEIEERLVVCQS